jgi:DNA-binding LacI/PurR family transcriptional regulator
MVALSGSPSLTTVEIDFENAGFMAAELLDYVLSNPSAKHGKRFFGPLRLIRCGSTVIAQRKDQVVADAREYIRRHCADGISSRDVAALFPCSRRAAQV